MRRFDADHECDRETNRQMDRIATTRTTLKSDNERKKKKIVIPGKGNPRF